jgi:hypothetical protein
MPKPKRTPRPDDVLPTPERMRKAEGYFVKGDTGMTTLRDAPLERLEATRVITPAQYSAAIKFRHHWHNGGLSPRFSAVKLDGMPFSQSIAGMPETEWAIHHRDQYRVAIRLLGMRRGMVVERISAWEWSAVEVGRALGWKDEKQARAAAVEILRDGLDALAGLWGIS